MSLKIAFVIPSLTPGGMERVMSQVVNYVADNKTDEVHLVLYGKKSDIFYQLSKKIIVHTHDMVYDEKHRILYTFKTLKWLRKEIKAIAPDTILSFGEIWNNLVMIALTGLKYSIYLSDRCQPNKSFGRLHDTLRKWLYPKVTGIIAQTQKAKEIYQTQFNHNHIVIIGNPIRSIAPRNIKKENIVVSVGRLISTKNFDQMIDIFTQIDDPDWKLVIVGGDALKQSNSAVLQQQIDKLGMRERIILAGTQKDVESYLLRSRIFAFTSSSEGFPNVVGEAMSAGLPVVAYDCVAGPNDMVVNDRNGYLIPLFDKDAFGVKLKYLMDNPQIAEVYGHNAKHDIKRFSADSIGEEFYKTITENA